MRMRASDADRERVAGVLRDAFAEGRLSPVEHEERLAEVYAATTYGDLVPVLHDLPVPPGTLAVPMGGGAGVVSVSGPPASSATGQSAVVLAPDLAAQGETSATAVFGGFERKGRWVLAPKMNATCIFGGGNLDLSQVVLTSAETEIQVTCLFGGVELRVPEGIAVRVEATAIFGGHDVPALGDAPAGAPLLRITGAVIFGGVAVKRPKPKNQWRKRLTGG
jgi:hypothetical protein